MAVADTLQELATDISNAYDSISDKGGTIPQDKNTNNLATAIASILSSPLHYASGTVRWQSASARPYINYNLDFTPKIVLVSVVRDSQGELPTTSGIDGQEIFNYSDGFVNFSGYGQYNLTWQNRSGARGYVNANTANSEITAEYCRLTYFYGNVLWRADTDYEWIAIG